MAEAQRDELGLDEGLAAIIGQTLKRVRTAMPAEVISFNESQNTVTVQPLLQRKVRGVVSNMPPVMDVPVVFYGGGGFVVTFTPEPGDVCTLVVCDRSLAAWKNKGGITDPADHRSHDVTDSVAVFGLNAFGAAYQDIKSGIDIRSRDGQTSLNVGDDIITASLGGEEMLRITPSQITLTVGSQVLVLSTSGLSHNSKNIGSTHVHPGVSPGPANTGAPL